MGHFAVQIAKAFGAEVTGVCSTAKVDLVRALGADHVIDYTADDFANGELRYDVILDIGGNRRLSHLRRALTPRGTLVIVGGETGGRWLGGFDRSLRAVLLSLFVRQKLGMLASTENAKDLNVLRDLIETGQVTPALDRTYPLSEAAAAIRYVKRRPRQRQGRHHRVTIAASPHLCGVTAEHARGCLVQSRHQGGSSVGRRSWWNALVTESLGRSQHSTSVWTMASMCAARNGRSRALALTQPRRLFEVLGSYTARGDGESFERDVGEHD